MFSSTWVSTYLLPLGTYLAQGDHEISPSNDTQQTQAIVRRVQILMRFSFLDLIIMLIFMFQAYAHKFPAGVTPRIVADSLAEYLGEQRGGSWRPRIWTSLSLGAVPVLVGTVPTVPVVPVPTVPSLRGKWEGSESGVWQDIMNCTVWYLLHCPSQRGRSD